MTFKNIELSPLVLLRLFFTKDWRFCPQHNINNTFFKYRFKSSAANMCLTLKCINYFLLPFVHKGGGSTWTQPFETCSHKMRDKLQNFISRLLPIWGPKIHYFPWEIPLFSIDFWNVQWAISPLVPWRFVTHFVRTGLIFKCFLVRVSVQNLQHICIHLRQPSIRKKKTKRKKKEKKSKNVPFQNGSQKHKF